MGEEIRVSADFTELIRQAEKVRIVLDQIAASGGKTLQSIVQIDLANKRVVGSLKEVTEAGIQNTKVIKELEGVIRLVSTGSTKSAAATNAWNKVLNEEARALEKARKAIEKDTLATKKNEDAKRAAATATSVSSRIRGATSLGQTGTQRFADPTEIARAENAITSLTRAIGSNSAEARNALLAFNNFTDKGIRAFNKLAPETKVALRGVEVATSRLKNPVTEAKNELIGLNAEARRLKEGEKFIQGLANQFKTLNKNADPKRVQQFNNTLINLRGVMEKTGVTSRQLQDIWKRLQSNTVQTFSRVEKSVVKALATVNAAMRATQAQSKATTDTMSRGFSRVSSIIIGGSINRGFFAITSALRESVNAAKEFSIAIGEIRTLSKANTDETAFWSAEVFKLSSEFGRVAKDVAEGVYQTLSNQIAQGTEAINFLRVALRLSLATVSDTETAVNALSSVINSFDLNVREAARVSSQFFKIIELGRIRLSELANTIGRVTVLASQLGVSFAEVGAFLSLATISGVKANEAQTQLRNVFLKLLKPTADLKLRFKALGFESGKAFIEARGFAGVMEFLAKTIREEGVEAIAEMFGRVRAITGALQAGGDGIEKFRDSFERMTISIRDADKAAETIQRTFGQRFQVILTDASNFFNKEFGIKFVKTIVGIVEGLGGAEAALRKFFLLLQGIGAAVVGAVFASLLLSLQKSILAIKAMDASMKTFGVTAKLALSPTGVFILIAAVSELTLLLLNAWEESTKAALEHDRIIREGELARLEIALNARAQIDAQIRDSAIESARVWFESIAKTRANLFELQKEFKLRNEEIAASLEKTIDATTSAAKRLIKEPADELKRLLRQIETAEATIKRIVQTTEGKIFERTLKDAKGINDEVALINERIELLRKRAKDALTVGGGDAAEANRAFSQAQRLLELLANKTNAFNSDRETAVQKINDLENKRAKLVQAQLKKRATLETRLRKLTGSGKGGEAERLNRTAQAQSKVAVDQQRKLTEQIREQRDILAEGVTFRETNAKLAERELKLLNEQEKLFEKFATRRKAEAEERKKELEEDKKVTAEFFEILKQVNNIEEIINKELIAGVSLRKAEKNAAALIQKAREQASSIFTTKDTADDLIALENSLQERLAGIRERFRLKEVDLQTQALRKAAEVREKELEQAGFDANQAVKDLTKEVSELNQVIKQTPGLLRAAEEGFKALRSQGDLGSDARAILARRRSIGGPDAILTEAEIQALEVRLIKALSLSGQAFRDEIFAVQRDINKQIIAREKVINALEASGRDISRTDATTRTLQTLENLLTRTSQLFELRGVQDRAIVEAARIQTAIEKINQLGVATLSGLTKFGEGLTDFAKELSELNKILNESDTARSLVRRRAEGRAKGGFIDFRRQGTDTVPAMLTPGEFVVNRRSTASFLPILRAINSGTIKPQKFAHGGTVEGDQNVSIGDITINAGSAHIDDNALLRGLKRLHFQGRSRLKP